MILALFLYVGAVQADVVRQAQLIENPGGRVPLAAEIRFNGPPVLLFKITISDGQNVWGTSFEESNEEGQYSIPVVGMRPDREHQIELELTDRSGASQVLAFRHRTPPLPIDPREFPNFDVQVSVPELMEPGVTFLSVRRRALGRPHWLTQKQRDFATEWGMLLALDSRGEVIWYYQSDSRTAGIDRLRNGNILMHRTNSSTLEIDLLGNTVRKIYAEDRPFPPPDDPNALALKGMQTLHHQPHELPNGDLLAFSANAYEIPDYPTSETDPNAPKADQMVMADTIMILNTDGDVVWSWNTMDYLDPYRIGYDTFWSYWWVRGFDQHMDWTHGNGLSYDESDDSILVSLRNQSAILKIDRATKEIKWILGHHKDWPENLRDKLLKPIGDLMWPAYQHNPRMTAAGNVILFDNRSHGGAWPFETGLPVDKSFSRGVEYAVDEENMTVTQVWTTGDTLTEDSCYANAMSDAWRLPKTDNHLVVYAFCVPREPNLTQDTMDHTRRYASDFAYGGRVVEYANNEEVFRAEFSDQHDLMQWEVYGGFRYPGIYSQGGSH